MTEIYDIDAGIAKRRVVDGVWVPFSTENDPEPVQEYIKRIRAFLPGWTNVAIYTQPGSIDGDLYDHPVKITIPYNSSYMRSDFGDIRFSTVDRQLLDYHIESKTNGVTATFVVKVPYLPKSPGATEILVYAGKSNATTTSNPDNVYLFSDYATGKYSDKWVNVNGSGSYGIVSGKQAIKLNSATTIIKNNYVLSGAIQIEAYLLASSYITQIQYSQKDTPSRNDRYGVRIGIGSYKAGIMKDGAYIYQSSASQSANTWVKVKLTRDTNGVHTLHIDDSLLCQAVDRDYDVGLIVLVHATSGTGAVAELRISPHTQNPPAAGSLGAWETSRLVTETLELTVHGVVFGENPESPLPAASFGVTVFLSDGEYTNLTGFSIDKDKSSSTFEVDISSQEDELFMTGQDVLINKYTGGSSKKLYFGIVDDVTDNQSNAKREYAIKGHGLSQQLVKYGFTWVCSGGKIKKTVKPAKTIISNYILSGTDIEMGPGVDLNLNITNYSKAASGWCGSFDTKKAAIDSLLSLVSEYAGKVVNWFIDKDGKFRTFYGEDRDNDLGIVITDTNPRIISLGVGENSENIVNKITGYYGKKGQYSITLQNNDSIYGWTDDEGIEHPGYGICKGEDITNKDITKKSTMQRKLQMILNRLSMPIYSAELELARYPEVEIGQPLYLPDHPRVNQETFIVSKVKLSKNTTKISATTDLNAVSPPSEYQSVRVVAQKVVSKAAPKAGTIVESDTGNYVIQLDSGGTTLNVNDLS